VSRAVAIGDLILTMQRCGGGGWIVGWNRLLSVWNRLEPFGTDSKRLAWGLWRITEQCC